VDDEIIVVPEVMVTTIREGGSPVARRPVGRPRKIVAVQPVEAVITPSKTPPATVSPNVDGAGAIVRRPVGRPRKMVVAEPTPTSTRPSGKVQFSGKADKPKQVVRNRGADDQEPVQWWIEGWKGR
jgi:hypothetical protein